MLSVAHLATWCAAPFAALLITAMPHGALSEEIAGGASVINADTIEIRGERIRLEGIDAPESSQLCEDETGDRYRCGQLAALALDDFLIDKTVRCEVVGRDRYQRALGDCFAGDVGLSDMLVRAGLAIAYRRYSKEFIGAEDEAKAERRGIWAGRFVEPWKWRKGERL